MYSLAYHTPKSSFTHMLVPSNHTVPERNEMALYQAVYAALEKELFYTSDVYEFVTNELKDILTPELLKQGKQRVENGWFGMDIFNMRKVVEAVLQRDSDLKALKLMNLSVGDKLKNFSFKGNRFSTIEITGINDKDGMIAFNAKKRGSRNRWEGTVRPSHPDFVACFMGHAFPEYITHTKYEGGDIFTIDACRSYVANIEEKLAA